MLRTKKADRIVAFFTAVMLIGAVCLWGAVEPVQGDGSHEIGYESLLFDKSRVHTIEITAANWDEVIANAAAEEYRECDITIDGEKLGTVGIRAKGNTSLSSVATLGSTRYSFKVEFNHYTKGKTYHGLDKLSLNNLIQDSTMMKDYLAYTLMGKMGVPSSLCSYVQISVNGEAWGLYLAVEGVEDAFLERNGMTKGELYKPDSMSFGGGRGNGRDFDIENFREKEEDSSQNSENSAGADPASETPAQESPQPAGQNGADFGGSSGMPAAMDGTQQAPGGDFTASSGDSVPQMPDGGFLSSNGDSAQASDAPENTQAPAENTDPADKKPDQNAQGFPAVPGGDGGFGGGFGGFNFGMGNDDVKLVYTDDDPDSYSNIFNNAKTKVKTKDQNRLIASLKKLNEKDDLDNVVNKDEVITYLAVHNFLCNDDSYTGMMVHNYYLYEENGELSIIPWDYNLGFGGFTASQNATSTVNSPIDSPVSSGTTESRPLIAWIFSDEEALAQYHETYDRFITECIESGWLESEISRVHDMIASYVEQDPSAFYTTEEFEKAVETMKTFCAKRGESIRGQLEGTIPSTTNGQRNSDALVDASGISTADMGIMNNGQGGGFGGGEMPSGMPDMSSGNMPSGMPSNMPGGMNPSGGNESNGTDSTEKPAAPAEMPADSETGTLSDAAKEEKPAGEADDAGQAAPAETEKAPQNSADGKTDRPSRRENPSGNGFGGNFPGGGPPDLGGFPGNGNDSGGGYSTGTWIWLGACAAALLAAILIIRKARDHNH